MNVEIVNHAGFNEMVAPEGHYLTQAAENIEDRIFCSRRVLLPGEQVGAWRVASAQEKAEHEAQAEQEIEPFGKITG